MPGPLDGLLVVDFSTLLPGPLATLMLAEAGAEVIKIERPGTGDELRTFEPRSGDENPGFAVLARGKKSVALDLKSPSDRARLDPLLDRADILVEQFRPGVMDRLGLGYAALAARNPRLVYCAITGYGQTGPKRHAAGHDLNYIGDAGLLSLSMGPVDNPVVPPALIADIAGGTYPAVLNILLALRERDRTGRGAYLDIAMAEGVLPFAWWAIAAGGRTGRWPGNGDALLTGGTPRYRIYPLADGRFAAVAAIEQRFWLAFTTAIGLPADLRDDAKDPAATITEVARILRDRPSGHWRPVFAAADCCATVVATLEEAMADPQFGARGVLDARVTAPGAAVQQALPVPIAPAFRPHARDTVASPALGQHTEDVLGEFPGRK